MRPVRRVGIRPLTRLERQIRTPASVRAVVGRQRSAIALGANASASVAYVTGPLLEGAIEYPRSEGAPAVEAYPVDPPGQMDTPMAFVGTRSMFQRAGFRVIGTTDAVASKMPRLIMRRELV